MSKKDRFSNRGTRNCDELIIPSLSQTPCLTCLVETLENFQNFEPTVRRFAIALHATELGISELHCYRIEAAHAGLLGIEAKVGGEG